MRLLSWAGELPRVGDRLQSQGGTRYDVIAIRETRPGSKSRAVVDLLKFDPGEAPAMEPGQRLYPFQWCAR
ncbi:MAG: hypothetical protein DI568_16685 [Sphingomonas sp.]|nr:MAG: hypothetical protein DI568_16685 [Sphingomonas sp.]